MGLRSIEGLSQGRGIAYREQKPSRGTQSKALLHFGSYEVRELLWGILLRPFVDPVRRNYDAAMLWIKKVQHPEGLSTLDFVINSRNSLLGTSLNT
jgi:hypothetical protein